MLDLASATALSITAVLVITEILKLVPVAFTSKYPAWVNGIVSVIAAIIVVHPTLTFTSVGALIAQVLFVSVVAALAYNQWTSKLKSTSTTTIE
jgi:hypothetical protein